MATKSTDSAIEQHGLNVIPEADRHGKAIATAPHQ